MWKTIERVSAVGGAIGLLGIAIAIGFYALDLEWRVRSLEARQLVVTTTPTSSADGTPNADPVGQACLEVSVRLAKEIERLAFGSAVDAYKDQLRLLGCDKR